MRVSFFFLGALASTVMSQQILFTNTSFDAPVTVGYSWSISWTDGSGLPVSLSIGNSSWSYPIFTQIPALPNTYNWVIPAPAAFVTGNYQLALSQVGAPAGQATYSPIFIVNVPLNAPSTITSATATMPPAKNTGVVATGPVMTIETETEVWEYWDHECGCTKTNTAPTPVNTGPAVTTYTWYEEVCGCTKSAIVPVASTPTTWSNYTAPVLTPVPTMISPTTAVLPNSPTPAPSAVTTSYKGDAVKVGSSLFGLVMLFVVAIFA